MKKKFLSLVFAICLIVPCIFMLSACGKDPDEDQPSTYTVAVSIDGQGQVTGVGDYESGETVALTPVAEDGYAFYKWSDGVKNEKRYITGISEDINLTAYFKKCTLYTISGGTTIRAFGENTIIERYGNYSYTYGLKSAVNIDDNEYLVQGDWYSVDYGELSAEPVSDYSYLNVSNIYTRNDFEFIPKDTTDYIFVRHPDFVSSPVRVGNYNEVTAGSDRVWPINANSTFSKTENGYSIYNYTINTNLENENPTEEMYVYAKYNTSNGVEYRFVSTFITCSLSGTPDGTTRELYYALSNNKLMHITVNHA